MSTATPIDPHLFVQTVEPLLERSDLSGLLALLRTQYSPQQIMGVLACKHGDARKVAALAVGLVGSSCCIPHLLNVLKDPDPMANEMAEHALWSIWFRAGSPAANQELKLGMSAMGCRDLDKPSDLCKAIRHFSIAIEIDPSFAEAYNQRAIAYYLLERYQQSVEDCQRTVERMDCHFPAWAGMGHGHAHLGQICDAIHAYEKAIDINPHLSCVKEAAEELKRQRGGENTI